MTAPPPGYSDRERQAASRWVARLHSGSCTPADRRAFAAWLAERESHQAAYAAVRGVWDGLESLQSLSLPELAAARKSGYRGWGSGYRKAAAVAGLALTGFFVAAVLVLGRPAPIETYRSARGEQRSLTLPDGSEAVLDTDTLLRTRISSTARTIYLDRGQAYFTVRPDRERPFEVRVEGGRIRDLGTRFDVYRRADRVSVTVTEGKVSVASGDQERPTELRAGERIAFGKDGRLSAIEPADVAAATQWLTGKLSFRATPLGIVLEEVARYHEAKLLLADPRLRRLSVTGTFNPRDLERFLTNIETMLSLEAYRLADGTIVLYRDLGATP